MLLVQHELKLILQKEIHRDLLFQLAYYMSHTKCSLGFRLATVDLHFLLNFRAAKSVSFLKDNNIIKPLGDVAIFPFCYF